MLGPGRHPTRSGLTAHSRIHLFVRCSLAEGREFARQDILLVLDGAPNHRCGDLAVPANISLLFLPPYSPELNPKENLWDEIREKLFKNYALKSIDAVRRKLEQAILYIERNPETVKSITSFPYIVRSL